MRQPRHVTGIAQLQPNFDSKPDHSHADPVCEAASATLHTASYGLADLTGSHPTISFWNEGVLMPVLVYAGEFASVALVWYGLATLRTWPGFRRPWVAFCWWLGGAAYTAAVAGFVLGSAGILPQLLASGLLLVGIVVINLRRDGHA